MLKKSLIGLCFCFCLMPLICYGDIKVVTVMPKSGDYEVWGNELTEGAQIAVDEINKKGGLKGQKLKLISIDDACSETLALSTAQMLSLKPENKPTLVIGPYCSDGLENIAKTYKNAKIFQIVPAMLSAAESNKTHSGLIKLFGNKEQAATDLFSFYNEHFAGENVALISSTENQTLDSSILKTFKNHGKSTLIHQYDPKNFEDIDHFVAHLNEQNEKIIFIFDRPKHTAKIIKKLKQLNKNAVFITSRYIATPDFFENALDYLDTTYFMALSELEDKPQMAKEFANLRLKGIEFKGLNIYGYTAVKMWAELVKSAKTTNYDKLAQYIKKHGFKTSWGETFFNNGNIKKPLKYSFYKFQGQEYVLE